MSGWIEFTGSLDQIESMYNCKNGFLLKSSDHMYENEIMWAGYTIDTLNVTHYLICTPHPLVDMICQQAKTGQPVYMQYTELTVDGLNMQWVTGRTNTPNWNILGAIYNFTPFRNKYEY